MLLNAAISILNADVSGLSCLSGASGSSGSSGSLGGSWTTLLIPVLLIVVMLVVMIIPQRRRDKKVKDMLSSLKQGDRVVVFTLPKAMTKVARIFD